MKIVKSLLVSMMFILSLLFVKPIQSDAPDWLEPWYLGYNVKYFNNELPTTKIFIDHELKDDATMAVTHFIGEIIYIRFNRRYEPDGNQARETLLHEMCHIRLKVDSDFELDNHGQKWQACMHKLANQGAFEDLW